MAYRDDFPDYCLPVAETKITQCSTFAVVCRLKAHKFTITSQPSTLSLPGFPLVKVHFPSNAVSAAEELHVTVTVSVWLRQTITASYMVLWIKQKDFLLVSFFFSTLLSTKLLFFFCSLSLYINNSLHLTRKHACGYLFANIICSEMRPRAKFEENVRKTVSVELLLQLDARQYEVFLFRMIRKKSARMSVCKWLYARYKLKFIIFDWLR